MQASAPLSSSPGHRSYNLLQDLLERLQREIYDVAIIGGGINGAVAAAAASAAGLKVALVEKNDFASSTSQESSNLVWGGIKYLESYEFGLVWDLCRSRNELMRHYPLEVKELRFFTNLERGFRKPRFLVYLGALLYWFMGRFKTQAPRLLSRSTIQQEEPIVAVGTSQGGLEYSDCYLKDNDARFVFHFIRRAQKSGATTLNYTDVKHARWGQDRFWHIEVDDRVQGATKQLRAKVLINAAGPYADQLNAISGIQTRYRHIFSKGVHLIVRRLTESEKVLTFFADDGRLFFVIPMGACSCIGTTDTRVQTLPPRVEPADRQFILENINKRLTLSPALTEADVISERCGVRPLVVSGGEGDMELEDWVQLSRKHEIETKKDQSHISIFGGKLTDCLNIGREILVELKRLGLDPRDPRLWYGEGAAKAKQQYFSEAKRMGLAQTQVMGDGSLAERLWRNYGEDALSILELLHRQPDLQQPIVSSAPVILAEAAYMGAEELVVDLEDFLRRRTRLSLVVGRMELAHCRNLYRACELLFGSRAEDQWQRYFKTQIPA